MVTRIFDDFYFFSRAMMMKKTKRKSDDDWSRSRVSENAFSRDVICFCFDFGFCERTCLWNVSWEEDCAHAGPFFSFYRPCHSQSSARDRQTT